MILQFQVTRLCALLRKINRTDIFRHIKTDSPQICEYSVTKLRTIGNLTTDPLNKESVTCSQCTSLNTAPSGQLPQYQTERVHVRGLQNFKTWHWKRTFVWRHERSENWIGFRFLIFGGWIMSKLCTGTNFWQQLRWHITLCTGLGFDGDEQGIA